MQVEVRQFIFSQLLHYRVTGLMPRALLDRSQCRMTDVVLFLRYASVARTAQLRENVDSIPSASWRNVRAGRRRGPRTSGGDRYRSSLLPERDFASSTDI